MTVAVQAPTSLFKVKLTDEVNGQTFTFSAEYTAETEAAARVKAYHEFGLDHNNKMSPTVKVVSIERVKYQASDVAINLFGV